MTPYKLSLWLRIAKLTPSHPLAWRIEWLRLRLGDRREGTGGSHKSAPRRGGSGRVPLRRRRAQGRKRRAGDCSTVPEAGREPAELGEEPPRRGAEHAAPACSARVHPAQRGGDRAEAVAPGRCLGPDRLHVSPARSHVHRLSPVRRPDVLRYQQNETQGDRRADRSRFSEPPSPAERPPQHCCLPPQPLRAAGARGASCSPGAPPPARAPSPARGRFAAVINKEGRQAHPSKSCCCMRPSQPPRNRKRETKQCVAWALQPTF
ncbi:serine/arginine-rich splicing factor SR45-like [Phoca vitulina]|uniref:serine/arginine-rich splicing factor SR45-like n=1 Tax=Phoca vitulina TaxID=9720 RepID=UPI0013965167|nr:serine/arginine-rich splicing factor SR45-like [Phoca vitulina]